MQKKVSSRIRLSPSDRALKEISCLVVGSFGLICLYPLLLTMAVSLTPERLIASEGFRLFPGQFTLDTYTYIFAHSGSRILRSYGVTLFITIAGTLGAVAVTTMISFALSIKALKYRGLIAFLCNFTLIFSSGIVPWYVVCVNWYGLQNNIMALIVPSLFSVWQMFLMRTYFSSVPSSLYEAALIDGAGYFTIYRTIAMPVSKTAVLTIGMMYALTFWNDWWHSLMFINDKNLFPLQYYLYSIVSNVQAVSSGRIPPGAAASIRLPSETVKMAVTIITIGPIIFLYPFVQRYFVQGIIMGAVKE